MNHTLVAVLLTVSGTFFFAWMLWRVLDYIKYRLNRTTP